MDNNAPGIGGCATQRKTLFPPLEVGTVLHAPDRKMQKNEWRSNDQGYGIQNSHKEDTGDSGAARSTDYRSAHHLDKAPTQRTMDQWLWKNPKNLRWPHETGQAGSSFRYFGYWGGCLKDLAFYW